LQSTLPALLTEGVQRRGLTLTELVRMTSAAPARLFGFDDRKGRLVPGADADLVLVDPHDQFELQSTHLLYRNPHSAYVGAHFVGTVQRTISRGLTVFREGRIIGPPGHGRRIDGTGLRQAAAPEKRLFRA
jgi:allantoinase